MAIKASVVSAGAILRAEVIFWRTSWEPRRFGRQRDDDIDPRRQPCRFALNAMVV
jgi:hypothetical protein